MTMWLRARLFPKTLRSKLLVMTLLMVSIPLSIAGIVVDMTGREAREMEKRDKLYGLAHILDSQLGPGFDAMLAQYQGPADDRAARIAFLNQQLRGFTDLVANANPGVGVGYYSRELDAIVTYGPSSEYGATVGRAIAADHPGRMVMDSGRPAVRIGDLVRGSIMNAMVPIVRDGRTIGYIWANELISSIEEQSREMDQTIAAVTMIGILLGAVFAHAVTAKLSRDIHAIKTGLARMRFDLGTSVKRPSGELGEVADAVNAMAEALRGALSLNGNILNSIADGVIAIDVKGQVTSINPAARRMMGLENRPDVIGLPYRDLYAPDAAFASVLLDTLDSGREHIGVPLDCPLPDQTLHVNVSSSSLKDPSGTVIGAVAVLKDLSEQHRLQKQIMRADRLAALGELVAGVAHEIRNPLTSIRGFVQYLETGGTQEEWQRFAPLIIRQVDSLNRIVTELLEFGRHRPAQVGPVRLNDLVRELTVLAGAKAATRICLDFADDLPVVNADGEALKQVVLNLLINAVQAISDTGTVTIATAFAPGADEVTVSVRDDGCGIAAEDLEKIFDPFFSTKPTGTGLGLAVVHRIMDAHRGTITVDSTRGVGTTVMLRLPLAQPLEAKECP